MHKETIIKIELVVFVEAIFRAQREIMDKMVMGVVTCKIRMRKIKELDTKDKGIDQEHDAKDVTN